MRTIETKVYSYGELSDEAKERARYEYEEHNGGANWERGEEYIASIKALAEHFGGKVTDYSLDWAWGPRYMSFAMPDTSDEKWIRQKLAALGSYNRRTLKGHGDCKLTGMCYDESAIDGFRIAFVRGKVRDLIELMRAAFDTWMEAARKDYEYDFGDEGLTEHFDANGYEFTEKGEWT